MNYESVFLLLFVEAITPDCDIEKLCFRCAISPVRKIYSESSIQALKYCSFVNYQLALLSIKDKCLDSSPLIRVFYSAIYHTLNGNTKYRLLKETYPLVAAQTESICSELNFLESAGNANYDKYAQMMGKLLYVIVKDFTDASNIETDLEFTKHIGMWIYLIDAFDDYYSDKKSGNFNPLMQFGKHYSDLENLKLGEIMLNMMTANMTNQVLAMRLYKHQEIIKNIITFGTRNAVQRIRQKRTRERCGGVSADNT